MEITVKSDALNLTELEGLARERLSPMAYGYYASGACDQRTLAENHEAYQEIKLHPRMLVDVSKRTLATSVLGQAISMPVIIAPTAFHRMAHPEGEVATARAAAKAGTIFTLSTLSNSSIEEVTAAATGPVWFQLYVYRDRGITKSLVQRAEAAGCTALVFTVDAPLLGRREADVRNGFQLPTGLTVANLMSDGMEKVISRGGESGLFSYIASLFDSALTWSDIEWLRSITKLPILVKGVLRADDAVRAVEHGASAIIVSNHGGRQLDTVPATITVLPEIVDAVSGKVEVLVDGGIRRGTDIIKALAYGARAVLVGRPVLWGLTLDGEAGVSQVLSMLRAELDLALALSGCPSVQEVSRDLIFEPTLR